MVFLAKKA